MTIAVVDYGSGNLRSAAKALERVCAEAGLDARVIVTDSAAEVAQAARIVLPGQGAFRDCWRGLNAVPGMVAALQDAVIVQRRPFLGICVGMQLMASVGREHGDCPGLDWIPGEVVALTPSDPALKIPHMGWNELNIAAPEHPVLAGLGASPHVYFVHSYHFVARHADDVLATVDYGGTVAAIVGRGNMIGTQFHPEKSQAAGLRLLRNFVRWQA
jgi:glutamine amidotransferase